MLRQRPLVPALVLALSASVMALTPANALADLGTCLGKPVTIIATSAVTTGTAGDDVVAMAPNDWNVFDAGAGNDTICLDIGKAVTSGRDPHAPFDFLDAGAGDDVVVNLEAGTAGASTTVVLGSGSDTFTGADVGEKVYADAYVDQWSGEAPASTLTGPQQDTITGVSEVHSFAPSDGPNEDRIAFGSRGAKAFIDGPMGSQGSLAFPAEGASALTILRPTDLAAMGPGDVMVDNVNRHIMASGEKVLAWSGRISEFNFGNDNFYTYESQERPISFRGSDDTEYVSITGRPVGDVTLGGGRDTVTVDRSQAFLPRSMDGGAGKDRVVLESTCLSSTIRMGEFAQCDGLSSPFVGFESAKVTAWAAGAAATHVTLVGSNAGETLGVAANQTVLRGRGGSDSLTGYGQKTRISGGSGRDVIFAGGGDVVGRGGPGPDKIWLMGSAPHRPDGSDQKSMRHVALGGPGADTLVGTSPDMLSGREGKIPDRLIGGPGHDRADGRGGKRDYCIAEITKNCERP